MGVKVERYNVTASDPRLNFIRGPGKAALLHLPSTLSLAPRCYTRLQPESDLERVCTATTLRLLVGHCAATKRSVMISFDVSQNSIESFPSHVDYLRNGRSNVTIEFISVLISTDLDILPVIDAYLPALGSPYKVTFTIKAIRDDKAMALTLERSDGTLTLYYPSPEVPAFQLFGSDSSSFGPVHRLMCVLEEGQDKGAPECHYDGIKMVDRQAGGGLIRFPGLQKEAKALVADSARGKRVPGLEAAQVLIRGPLHCSVCAKGEEEGLRRCSGCGQVQYCGEKHQIEAWPLHKDLCKLNRKRKGA
ncbi:hypothetical protein BCR35DRAFT_330199 [Leucosporidium creatinivorum]|uniref:MYND-type domain-containing protein n=1 Tax=Leucosporidium creatinivorum TaxID=106004 RepID=A0A1Y2FXS3_9BASI|nr:hypothetical protein BCR35DRAFT_330199 [Leucosporidium creatinivorum]